VDSRVNDVKRQARGNDGGVASRRLGWVTVSESATIRTWPARKMRDHVPSRHRRSIAIQPVEARGGTVLVQVLVWAAASDSRQKVARAIFGQWIGIDRAILTVGDVRRGPRRGRRKTAMSSLTMPVTVSFAACGCRSEAL
jgi:hypothetical protein